MESDEKKAIIVGNPNNIVNWLKDVCPEVYPVTVWDSMTTVEESLRKSFACTVVKTDEEVEEIRDQEKERNRKNLHRMLSKPRRKR